MASRFHILYHLLILWCYMAGTTLCECKQCFYSWVEHQGAVDFLVQGFGDRYCGCDGASIHVVVMQSLRHGPELLGLQDFMVPADHHFKTFDYT